MFAVLSGEYALAGIIDVTRHYHELAVPNDGNHYTRGRTFWNDRGERPRLLEVGGEDVSDNDTLAEVMDTVYGPRITRDPRFYT